MPALNFFLRGGGSGYQPNLGDSQESRVGTVFSFVGVCKTQYAVGILHVIWSVRRQGEEH